MSAEALLAELARHGIPERVEAQRAYLKVDLEHLGVPMADLRRAVRQHVLAEVPDRAAAVARARELWARPVLEGRLAAVAVLRERAGDLTPDDLPLLEGMLRDSRTWALVDSLAADVVGAVAQRHDVGDVLDRWAADDDVWVRRSALLALLVPLRQGEGDWDRFARYADALLEDRSFWIRKAIGWVLRDTARRRPELVAEWLLPRARRAAGLTVREAVKHLPPALREAVLAARAVDVRPPAGAG